MCVCILLMNIANKQRKVIIIDLKNCTECSKMNKNVISESLLPKYNVHKYI